MHKNESGLIEIEIDGLKYEFEKWGAEMSLITLIKISKIVGKPLGSFLGSVVAGGDGMKTNITPDMLSGAFEALVQNMDEKVCLELIKKLSSEKILCDGKKIIFDFHYQDKLGHLFNVVKSALEVQYGDFFGELLGLVKVHQERAERTPMIKNHKAT